MIKEICARHPVKWWIVLGVLLVLLGVVQWAGADFTNGGFETGNISGWTDASGPPGYGSSAISSTVVNTGSFSCVLSSNGTPGATASVYQFVEITDPDTPLSFYLNIPAITAVDGSTLFSVGGFGSEGEVIVYTTNETTSGFELVSINISEYDAGTYPLYFKAMVGVGTDSVVAYIDDITIEGVEPEPTPTPGPENTHHLFWKQIKDDISQDYCQDYSYPTGAEGGTFFEWQDYLHLLTYPNGKLYRSSNGITWSLVNNWVAPFNTTYAPGGRFHPTIFSNSTMMLVVGGNYPAGSSDVWVSSDGLTWTQTTPDFTGVGIDSCPQPNGIDFNNYLWIYNFGNSTTDTKIYQSQDGSNWDLKGTSTEVLIPFVYGNKVWAYSPVYNASHDAFLSSTNGYIFSLEYEVANFSPLFESNAQFPTLISTHTGFFEWDDIFWLLGTNVWEGIYSTDNLTSFWNDRNETYKYGTYYLDYPHVGESVSFFPYYPEDSSHPEMIYSYYGEDPDGGEIWVAGYFPQAEFSGYPTIGGSPLTVTFVDESENEPTSWYWVFGDGSTSTSQNPTHTYSSGGTYTVQLYISNEYGSDYEVKIDYITVTSVSNVALWGHVIDAYNNTTIDSASVALIQGGLWHNTTSNATGGYTYGDEFYTGLSINATASKTGYTPFPVLFTVWDTGIYEVDLYVIPDLDEEVGETDAWIGGFAYDALWAQGIPEATVNIWNDTWSDTNISNSNGFFLFTNLTNTTYNLNATATTFDNSLTYNTTAVYGNFTQLDVPLEPNYQIDLTIRNEDTLAMIYDAVYVVFSTSTGTILSETNVTNATWSSGLINYGEYTVTASCEGYHPTTANVSLYGNLTSPLYLDPIEEFDGANTNYIPRPVRFTYVDAYGNPVTGATVTATALESTNPWTWLEEIFGFSSTVDIQGTVLSGTTGSDGTLSFMMIETIEYRVNCVKASAGINHTVDIYPKESEYFIRIGSLPIAGGGNYPSYSLNATTSGTNVTLFGNYTDTSGETSSVRFIVVNSTGGEVYNTSVTLTGGVGSASYAVNNTMYDQYTYGLVAEHDTHGTIEKWIDITLKGTGRLIDFGEGWTDFMYLVMSVACIFLVAGCFGEIDVRMGAIFIPITSGIFWFIGWMSEYYGGLITIAGVLGAIYYMRSKAKELDT